MPAFFMLLNEAALFGRVLFIRRDGGQGVYLGMNAF
jgi:hypothetical protein